ncbi:hypothetical protein [Marinimicrobium alkaliphilum]|uniref:hypothetical protein n=1 Tax=Marinimicrobium alkaliphilum TaxID=2202654 RepID=UPI0013003EB5|nr:hypothetical protein [Marinimicrobium alkaliphilum]
MSVKPNKGQRRQELMRLQAAERGLNVSLVTLPRLPTDTEAPRPIAAYCQRAGRIQPATYWQLTRAAYEHESHFLGCWCWHKEGRATTAEAEVLARCLPHLPAGVRAVSAGTRGWCVYWDERGGEPVLEQVQALVQALATTVTGTRPEPGPRAQPRHR